MMRYYQLFNGLLFGFILTADLKAQEDPSKAISRKQMKVLVVDESDKPIADTKVHVSIWCDPSLFPNRDFVTDQNGIVEFERPANLEILRLWAKKEKRVPMFAHWETGEHHDGVDIPDSFKIRLPTGHRLGGKIVDEDGNPIPGVKVEVMVEGKRTADDDGFPLPDVKADVRFDFDDEGRIRISTWLAEGDDAVLTDERGRWFIENAPASPEANLLDYQFHVFLQHDQFISDTRWRNGLVTSELRDEKAQCIMPRGFRIKGTAKSHKDNPVEKGIVVCGKEAYFTKGPQEVRIGKGGEFETPPLQSGRWLLTAVAPGSAPTAMQIDLVEDVTVDLVLDEPNTLVLKVVDNEGNPVPNASIGIDSWRGAQSLYNHKHPNVIDSQVPRTCDERGIFTWDWAPSDPIIVTAYAKGYESSGYVNVLADLDDQVIVLQPEAVGEEMP